MGQWIHLTTALVGLCALSCGARSGLDAPPFDARVAGDSAPADIAPLPPPEVCDGIDNDGNGQIDENIAAQTCGVGECVRRAPGCVQGVVPPCASGPPSREMCNGRDDDCNGAVDDGLAFGVRHAPVTVARGSEGEAASVELEPTPTGLLALWRVWFRGESPRPTTRTRVLDANGTPTGAILTPPTRAQTEGPRATPTSGGDLMLSYCARVGTEDVMTSLRMATTGAAIGGEVLRSGVETRCGAVAPDAVWTGERHVFAWATNTGAASPGYGVYVDVAADDGRSLGARTLRPDGELTDPPRFARDGASTLMLVGRRVASSNLVELLVYRVAADGTLADPPTTLTSPGNTRPRDAAIALGSAGTAVIVAQDDTGDGLLEARVSSGGAVVEPLHFGIAGPVRFSDSDIVARGDEFVVASDGYVLRMPSSEFIRAYRFDREGRASPAVDLRAPDEEWNARPSIAVREGRVFVLYLASLVPSGMEVRLVELGCTP